jgi:predicted RNA-binding Zn-ribbon protein involved in translation (DUF1610 family)
MHCGQQLPPATGRDAERGDLEVVEVARAVSSVGFDTEFRLDGDVLYCPSCGETFGIDDTPILSGQPAVDTSSGAASTDVITFSCPSCGIQGHAVVTLPDE